MSVVVVVAIVAVLVGIVVVAVVAVLVDFSWTQWRPSCKRLSECSRSICTACRFVPRYRIVASLQNLRLHLAVWRWLHLVKMYGK